MKICNACGKEYDFGEQCPHCGCINYNPVVRHDPIVENLSRKVKVVGFRVTVFSILWLICANLIIFSCVGNAVLYSVTSFKFIWCQYVVGALLSAMLILHGVIAKKVKPLKIVRNVSYVVISVLLVQLIQANTADDATILFMIMPILLAAVSVTAMVLLLTHKCGNFSYTFTVSANTVIGIVLAILMNTAPVKAGLIVPLYPIVTYVSLGLSAFLLVNFLALRIISWAVKLRHLTED